MTRISRRHFLKMLGAGSLIATAPGCWLVKRTEQPGEEGVYDALAELGLSVAQKAGAEYSDIRMCSYASQWLQLEDRKLQEMNDSLDSGFGIRVLVNGAWGFAASNEVNEEKVKKTVRRAVELSVQAARRPHRPNAVRQ